MSGPKERVIEVTGIEPRFRHHIIGQLFECLKPDLHPAPPSPSKPTAARCTRFEISIAVRSKISCAIYASRRRT